MNKKLAGTIQLTLTALIWGVAFVAQKAGMDYVGPWTFNCTRLIIGGTVPILYAGVMSCGIAYTLQLVGQKNLPPTPASLLMSLESVWSAIAGFVILHQTLSGQEILGCVLVFTGVILAQLPTRSKNAAAGNEKELSDGTECDMI